MNKIKSLILIGLLAIYTCIPVHADSITQEIKTSSRISEQSIVRLNDINFHWAKTQIQEFIDLGYISGYEDETFRPNKEITRAEFIKLVNRVFGYELVQGKEKLQYKDVKAAQWFYNDILIAQDKGYVKGYDDNTFRPNNNIKREEAAKIVSAIHYMRDDNIDKIQNYKDANQVSDWANSYIEYCLEREFLRGNENNMINPKGNMTRAEAIVILDRVKKGEKKLSATEPRGDIAFEVISRMKDIEVSHNETIEGNYDGVRFKNTNTFFYNYSGKYMFYEGVDTHLYFDSIDDIGVVESMENMIGNEEECAQFWDVVKINDSKGISYTVGIFAGRKVILQEQRFGGCEVRVYMPEK